MQIHELNSFVGTPGAGDYLAIDDGSETTKVEASNLGVTTQMTQAEAEAGTVTAPRVVTPSVFKASVESLAETVADTREALVVTVASFSSLPKTITNADISNLVLQIPTRNLSELRDETNFNFNNKSILLNNQCLVNLCSQLCKLGIDNVTTVESQGDESVVCQF